jgi:non-canonical purine NTP pyrophosphatase (RdgB/HAM1 family)
MIKDLAFTLEKEITFITGNAHKAEQVAEYLSVPIKHQSLELVEIQSLDLEEIVEHKAKEAFKKLGTPVLIEDVALTFHALGRLPGTLIKWFLGELKPEGLCKLLQNHQDRSATIEILYGLYDGKSLKTFLGVEKGTIASEPRGTRGFGFDVTFIPEGYDQTRGEMGEENYVKTSHRKKGLEKLEEYLKSF